MLCENLIYERKDGIAKTIINRPKVMNALSPAVPVIDEAKRVHRLTVKVIMGAAHN